MTSIPSPMAIFTTTSRGAIAGELVTALLEIGKIARCWSRPCVGDFQRRHAGRTSFSLIVVLLETQRAALPSTLSKILSHREFPGLLLDLVERVMRMANRDPRAKENDWLHLHEGPPPISCMQLSHEGHPQCAQLLGEHSHDSTRFAWPSCVQS